MLTRFRDFITREHLFVEGQQVLLAVSGGRDSVALCDLVYRMGQPFSVAHCNFHLRGDDSNRDEAFVRRLAAHYGVRCFVAHFDTTSAAASSGMSIEATARQQRYGFFSQVQEQEGFSVVATAHHRDDATETFFINLLRGTGIGGLHGIKPRNGSLVRPLLPFSRDDINAYIAERGLSYVDDYTNDEPVYLRNRIRLQLMPLLRQMEPSIDKIMERNIAHLADAEELYRQRVEELRLTLLHRDTDTGGFYIDMGPLQKVTPLPTVLFELLAPFGFSPYVVDELMRTLDGQSGAQWYAGSWRLIRDRQRLVIYPLRHHVDGPIGNITAPGSYTWDEGRLVLSLLHTIPSPLRQPCHRACFDAQKIHYPLHLRHWCQGDRFRPFGMQGSRLLSNFFIDNKFTLQQKEDCWLLCDSDDTILWIVNHRASAVASVTPQTREVLMVSYEKTNKSF